MPPPIRLFHRLPTLLSRRCTPFHRPFSTSTSPKAKPSSHHHQQQKQKSTLLPALFLIFNVTWFTHFTFQYLYRPSLPYGASMVPTISYWGDGFLLSLFYARGNGIKVGDLVSFKSPVKSEESGLKRVIGMPGDFVLRDTPGLGGGNGNGHATAGEEEGKRGNSDRDPVMIQVPQGHCWVVGDNLPASRDSRIYGPLPLALIQGKILYKIWPYAQWGDFRNELKDVEDDGLMNDEEEIVVGGSAR